MSVHDVYLIFILGTLVFTLFAFFLILFLIYYKRKQQIHATEKLSLQYQYQQTLLQTKLEVQEQSFKYFSQEIHDNVGAALSVCKLQLHELTRHGSGEQAKALIQNSIELLTKAVGDLRTISHTLNGDFIARAGLKEALEKELYYVQSAKKAEARLTTTGDSYDLGTERELLLFRIAQEAIANALKHAKPKNITVHADYGDNAFTLTVADDGVGFDMKATASMGLGLSNMQERAKLLSGCMQMDSTPELGTSISLQVPKHETNVLSTSS